MILWTETLAHHSISAAQPPECFTEVETQTHNVSQDIKIIFQVKAISVIKDNKVLEWFSSTNLQLRREAILLIHAFLSAGWHQPIDYQKYRFLP